MNKYKLTLNVTIIVLAALLVGTGVGIALQRSIFKSDYKTALKNDKLLLTFSLLENKYVDTLSRDQLTEMLVPLLLHELDPHSSYIPKEELAAANESLAGKFDGIGVIFNILTDTATITNVISGGPSSKAGVVAGDKIITVNDSIVAGRKMESDKLVKLLRGTKGSKVKIGVERTKEAPLVPITITRGEVPMRSVQASITLAGYPQVGYIRMARFASTTWNEFNTAMLKLKAQGATSVILDLRGNGGGYLKQSILIANEFLKKGQKIVYTEGARAPRDEQYADGNGRYQDMPLVVIIDAQSASASEVLSGALQDNDRATIVGLRSFGKGLVLEQFDYPDGSAARITIAHYYTPLGRSIQKPYEIGKGEDYNMELVRRYENKEYLNSDSTAQNHEQRFVTASGKILYGGGGIQPDVFVPLDTAAVSPYFRKLFNGNLIFRYATKFTDDNRQRINGIKNIEQLNKLFAQSNLYLDFVSWADRTAGIRPTEKELAQNRELITAQLRGYIGLNTPLGDDALYYYFYPLDKTLNVAVAVLPQK